MFLENVVFDAVHPRDLGRTWETTLGTEPLTDEPEGYETRLQVPDGPLLDLCFQRVPEANMARERLHLDVEGNGITAIRLEVGDPENAGGFWAWLTGWVPDPENRAELRHPSGRGPALHLVPEVEPKTEGKNPTHLDLRLEPGDDVEALTAAVLEARGRVLDHDWGDLPRRPFQDPWGNEFCLLPAPRGS